MQNVVVGDLIKIKAFNQQLRQITRETTGINNVVSHVTIMEAPDFYEWVTGGEFVLTTWYAFSINPDIQINNFKKLAKNISAIAIKTGRFIDTIPQEIIDIAEEYNIAVFEVLTKSKFREIVQIIASEIQNYQTNLLLAMSEYYQELMQLSLCSDSVEPLLSLLFKRTNHACFCMSSKYEVIAGRFNQNYHRETIAEYADYIKHNYQKAQEKNIGYLRIDRIHIFICQGSVNILGYLVIIEEHTLSEKIRLMCQQTAAFIALKLRENYETKQKEMANIWSRFLLCKYKDRLGDFERDLHEFGLKVSCGYTLLILENKEKSYQTANIIEHYVNSCLTFAYADKILMLISGDKYVAKDSYWIKEVIAHLEIDNKNELIVIAPDIKKIDKLLEAYTIAKNTYKIFRRYQFTGVHFAGDYVLMSMLMQVKDTTEYQYLQNQIIMPLQKYDDKNKSELLGTLVNAVFSNTLEETAKKMHVHINTLRYRLNKVEEITGKNFFDMSDRYIIMIACLLFYRGK